MIKDIIVCGCVLLCGDKALHACGAVFTSVESRLQDCELVVHAGQTMPHTCKAILTGVTSRLQGYGMVCHGGTTTSQRCDVVATCVASASQRCNQPLRGCAGRMFQEIHPETAVATCFYDRFFVHLKGNDGTKYMGYARKQLSKRYSVIPFGMFTLSVGSSMQYSGVIFKAISFLAAVVFIYFIGQ